MELGTLDLGQGIQGHMALHAYPQCHGTCSPLDLPRTHTSSSFPPPKQSDATQENRTQALSISDVEYLLFCADIPELFDDIPRYKFRAISQNSRGSTDKSWKRSTDATDGAQNSRVDIFETEVKEQVASILNRHLQWWKSHEDSLVSWTSSPLFHLHAKSKNRSTFDDIHLCIIDTNYFPKAVFLHDIDLTKAYASFDTYLAEFRGL